MSRWSENTADVSEQIGIVMHVEFSLGNTRMVASDSFDGVEVNADIKLMIHMNSQEEALQTNFSQILLRSIRSSGHNKEEQLYELYEKDNALFNKMIELIDRTSTNPAIIETCGHALYKGVSANNNQCHLIKELTKNTRSSDNVS